MAWLHNFLVFVLMKMLLVGEELWIEDCLAVMEGGCNDDGFCGIHVLNKMVSYKLSIEVRLFFVIK